MEKQETTYIPYGQNEISQQDLMTNLANGLPGFMEQYKWLQRPKNKEKFLQAYDNITKNLAGASDNSGRWIINVNNLDDIESLSPKDKEIYEHAAYYIQQQMAKMTPRDKEGDKKKEDLIPFNFNEGFNNHLLKGYGNNKELFADPEQGWNALDARGADGLRATTHRREAMQNALKEYMNSLEDGKYNFEGTPFTDLNDAKAKIQKAVDALNTEKESDDLPAFNALGLKYRSYFSNGGNEQSTHIGTDGNPLTWNQWNEQEKLRKEEEAKTAAAAKQEKLKAQRANYWKGFKTFNLSHLNGRPLTSSEMNTDYLNQLFNKGNWSGDEASQIVSAFNLANKNGKLVSLSKEEQAKLNPSIWGGRVKYLRKIDGLNAPLYYDTLSKQYKLFHNNGVSQGNSFQEVLDRNNPELKQKLSEDKYWNSPIKELDSYDYANVIGALADVVSIIDPEPISAASIAEIGTAARSYGRSKDTGFWENALYTTGDAALGALAAIPGLGDAGLGMRLTGTGLKYLGYAGLIFNAKNLPDASKAFSKWYSYATQDGFHPMEAYKKLTRKEAQDLQNGILELVGLKGAASGALSRKITKPIRNTKQKVIDLDVKIKGNNTKIQVTPEEAKQLRTGLKGKLDKSNDKLRQQSSVQKYAKDNNIEVKDIELVSAPGKMPFTRNAGMSQRTINTEGTASSKDFGLLWRPFAKWQTQPIFNSKNNNNSEGIFNKVFGGYKSKNNNAEVKPTESPTISQQPIKQSNNQSKWSEIEKGPKKWSQSTEAKEYKEMLKGNYSSNAIQGGTHKIGDMTFDVEVPRPRATNGFVEVTFKNGNKETIRFDTQKQLQERISKIIKNNRVQTTTSGKTKVDAKEMGKILKSLKARGLLKHGGKVQPSLDNIIEDFIKNNNI